MANKRTTSTVPTRRRVSTPDVAVPITSRSRPTITPRSSSLVRTPRQTLSVGVPTRRALRDVTNLVPYTTKGRSVPALVSVPPRRSTQPHTTTTTPTTFSSRNETGSRGDVPSVQVGQRNRPVPTTIAAPPRTSRRPITEVARPVISRSTSPTATTSPRGLTSSQPASVMLGGYEHWDAPIQDRYGVLTEAHVRGGG